MTSPNLLRSIDPDMDAAVVSQVDDRLSGVCNEHNVCIPWAIESGSRAWGFRSPDSDYDCRFIFARPLETTAALFPQRDVIEQPVTPVFDVGGWELGKAIKLMMKGNAVVIEWLTSPVIYRGRADFRDDMLSLAETVSHRDAVMNHYYRLARSMEAKASDPTGAVKLKRLFYVLRPLAALDWLEDRSDAVVAPMNFLTLLEQTSLPPAIRAILDDLLAQKRVTRELGTSRVPEEISQYIAKKLEHHDRTGIKLPKLTDDHVRLAEERHTYWLKELFLEG